MLRGALTRLGIAGFASFAAWDELLDAALDDATHRLGVVIPVDFDPLLDATNPHLDRAAAFEEVKSLLEFWLAYQRAYHQNGAYPLNTPSPVPLPADLLKTLETQFPEAFQRAFALRSCSCSTASNPCKTPVAT